MAAGLGAWSKPAFASLVLSVSYKSNTEILTVDEGAISTHCPRSCRGQSDECVCWCVQSLASLYICPMAHRPPASPPTCPSPRPARVQSGSTLSRHVMTRVALFTPVGSLKILEVFHIH